MKKLFPLFLFALIAFDTSGQSISKIGTRSPDLKFSNILNFESESENLANFKSKVVILDFWATWCGPCIASFPHLEDLQRKFTNDLQIITITNDSEERILKFLQNKKIGLPIVIDAKRELASQFPHRIIPRTVVIDKSGIIRAITTSSEINEEIILKKWRSWILTIPNLFPEMKTLLIR